MEMGVIAQGNAAGEMDIFPKGHGRQKLANPLV